jgi:Rieske Fe-S protein
LTKVAAYRDERGLLHEYSAICPHLGCIVEWNHNESTWDCPCHATRVTISGVERSLDVDSLSAVQ